MSDSKSQRSSLTGAPEIPVLDAEALGSLLMLAGGDPSFLDSVFSVFFQTTPGQLESMKALCQSADWEALRRRSHSLRGSCATLGALGFVEGCRKLESACKAANSDDVNTTIEALEIEFQIIARELANYKDSRP
jgi:HPt (histidine-containing phosphotransfer) domain-containing protein